MEFLDWAILGSYFAIVLGLGWAMRRGATDPEAFYLADRRVHWIPVLGSVIATEISAVTFLAVPASVFVSGFSYLQFGLGSIFARFVVAGLFLPAFFRSRCATPYAFLGDRFGVGSRRIGAGLFLVSRLNASGVRLLMAATGVGFLFGWGVPQSVLLFAGLALLYTAAGGIRAVIWTDLVQAIVFIGGCLAVVAFLIANLGSPADWGVAVAQDKFRVFHFAPEGEGLVAWMSDSMWFFIAFFNGLVMTTASLGCDQDLTQRFLTCRSLRGAQRSVILSGLIGVPVAASFLFVGAGLFTWYGGVAPVPDDAAIFAGFIIEELPAGLRGFLVAGVFAAAMSSLDSAMNALSSSVSLDFGRRTERIPARVMVLVTTALLVGLALSFALLEDLTGESLIWLGFQVAGITLGPLLGLFLLGLVSRRAPSPLRVGAAVGLPIAGGVIGMILIHIDRLPLGWSWLVVLAAAGTFLIGGVGSPRRAER